MKVSRRLRALATLLALPAALAAPIAAAAPLITSVAETGTALNANPVIATSASSPSPSGTSAALVDEAFAYTTRTHEYTAVRTANATGLLTTATDAATTLRSFPSYLNGLEYVQTAQENRGVADYSLNLTFSQPVKAYLLLDNRNNGLTTGSKANTSDPSLTGNLAWVVTDGWTRVNTGIMPNDVATGLPQGDYIGLDEGATVANETLRVHHDPGSGVALNQFSAIYTKNFSAGANVGVLKAQGNGSINMMGLAVAVIPEPSTALLSLFGLAALMGRRRR